MSGEKTEIAKLLRSLRDSFASAVEAIDAYLRSQGAAEAYPAFKISRNGKEYGRLVKRPNELVAYPCEELNIQADSPAIQKFLMLKFLSAMKQKHGVDYTIDSDNGKLTAVRVKGTLEQKEVEKLNRALAWAFEKASQK
jgi:hypothetical protein